MTRWPFLFVALGLWFVSAALAYTHWLDWRKSRTAPEKSDRHFAWRQFRRRIQATAMLALVGLGVLVGGLVPPREYPTLYVGIWCAVAAVLLWVVLLAMADALATRAHAMRSLRRYRDEAARFSEEMYRRGRRDGNGQRNEP